MKKIASTLMSIIMIITLTSCSAAPRAEKILRDFIVSYGAEGIIYSSGNESGEEGYITEELTARIYIYEGDFPENFAVFLNSHSHKGSEAAVFVCEDEDERQVVTEMCLERMKLIADRAEDRVLVRSGNIIAYSTMGDSQRAQELLLKIIRSRS